MRRGINTCRPLCFCPCDSSVYFLYVVHLDAINGVIFENLWSRNHLPRSSKSTDYIVRIWWLILSFIPQDISFWRLVLSTFLTCEWQTIDLLLMRGSSLVLCIPALLRPCFQSHKSLLSMVWCCINHSACGLTLHKWLDALFCDGSWVFFFSVEEPTTVWQGIWWISVTTELCEYQDTPVIDGLKIRIIRGTWF